MNRRRPAERTISTHWHCLVAASAIIVWCGLPAARNTLCQAQDGGTYERVESFQTQYGESENGFSIQLDEDADESNQDVVEYDEFDENAADFDEGYEEHSPRYGGNDFEDLPPAMQAVVIIIGILFFLVLIGITIFILYLLYKLLDALPPQYRLMEPGMVWLLLIPCFNLIWNFFVYTRISRSYQNYFYAHGRTDVGDCGATLGIWYSICVVLVSIPCLNYITGIFCGPAILVLLIIYLLKLHELKRQIPSGKADPAMDAPNPFAM